MTPDYAGYDRRRVYEAALARFPNLTGRRLERWAERIAHSPALAAVYMGGNDPAQARQALDDYEKERP